MRTYVESLEPRQLLSTTLTTTEVSQIIQAAAAVSLPSQTIAVVDRDGDVLALYGQAPSAANQNASPTNLSALETTDASGDLTGALVENTTTKYALIQAVARARTAAAFESTQDAFTSRTARFIVQNDFPQPITDTEAGPLLGVEFSAALGTDVLVPGSSTGLAAGLSGDPGGIPLFINGTPVGAIGVAGDGSDVAARQDLVPQAVAGVPFDDQSPAFKSDPTGAFYAGVEESDFDEAVAEAGAQGFSAPAAIQATNILVNGLRLPFTAEPAASGPPPAGMTGLVGTNGPITTPRSLFKYDPLGKTSAAVGGTPVSPYPFAEIPLTSGGFEPGSVRNNSPAAGGLGFDPGQTLTDDVTQIPIEEPDGSLGYESGNFGFLTGQPAPDGSGAFLTVADVTQIVSQAVTEALSIRGAIRVPSDVPAKVYVSVTDAYGNQLADFRMQDATNFSNDVAVQKARTAAFFSSDVAAFSSRAIGFLADNVLPPSQDDGVTGPLYQLQESLALPFNQISFLPTITKPSGKVVPNPLGNGITIFPGGAPLYIDGHLVGAVGISGDGVDQDDLIAYNGTMGFQAPNNIRSNNLSQSQIVSFLEQKINQLGYVPPAGDPHFTFPTISFLQTQVGFDDPDDPNLDGISITPDQTIIDRILERLQAKGIDSVNLPYQKFPRNPGI
jgi:uncharacterized protein GlcG (DUF336 family)